MKVLFDVSVLGQGYHSFLSRTGIFRVIENLASEIANCEEIELKLCAPHSIKAISQVLDYLKSENPISNYSFDFPIQQEKIHRKISQLITQINKEESINLKLKITRKLLCAFNNIIESITNPLSTNSKIEQIDLFHSPLYSIPPSIRSKRIKAVLTIYDLIPILYPKYFDFNKNHWLNDILNDLQHDDWITCISHSTKNDLCNYSKVIDPKKVIVTHLAASSVFSPCADEEKIQFVKTKYQIPYQSPYILSLATLEPRKNIDHTIRCFAALVKQERIQDLYLVLVGANGWGSKDIFKEISNHPDIRNRIIFTGYINDQDLSPLYSGAMFFVYPSLYEGFGLPPLEAMQCGVPVITSNTSSFPEVIGEAGIMVDPIDQDALCQSMYSLYSNFSLRNIMSSQSIEQAKKFSWKKCSREVINTYKLALQQ